MSYTESFAPVGIGGLQPALEKAEQIVNNDRAHGWFLTAGGRQFFPATPIASDIHIEDIAHALSQLCRFGGHSREFYSVAQHCVVVSRHVPLEHAFVGLMHDAAEAYLGDVIQPVKRLLPEYQRLESDVWRALCDAFPLPHCLPECVKEADCRTLMTERRDVMNKSLGNWSWGRFEQYQPYDDIIAPWCPEFAREKFLLEFELTKP